MTKQFNIDINVLRNMIKEELSTVNEQVDHVGIKDVVTGASKLMDAIDVFKQTAPASAINAVTPHLGEIERILEDMATTPGSYVAKPKVEPRKVSLRAVKGENRSR